ncbi:tetratricopeptide repeat protein [Caulobacter mirabilis]|uniref:Uncharacterized protein n=1 Tax=Caulobacter mirabilis TaxID=69666 RepID=A0A2D2AZH0_9CAUL|nr:tetratricopeptide repeat protein [Caulobacter mirabilis]ATQ43393.1 hypothetical protein CSW64_13715 [Caulobacter mirabilis]
MADWFRKRSWEADDQRDFEDRLAKAPTDARAQYLRLQALELGESRPAEALRLLDRALGDWPDHFETAATLGQRGDCLMALGDYENAVESYALAVKRMRSYPGVQTQAWLSCVLAIAERGDRSRFRLAHQILREFGAKLDQPLIRLRAAAAAALIARAEGRAEDGRDQARTALEAASLLRGRKVALAADDRALVRRIRAIAEPRLWRRWLLLGLS